MSGNFSRQFYDNCNLCDNSKMSANVGKYSLVIDANEQTDSYTADGKINCGIHNRIGGKKSIMENRNMNYKNIIEAENELKGIRFILQGKSLSKSASSAANSSESLTLSIRIYSKVVTRLSLH